MKPITRNAAVLCGMFLIGSSVYADQLPDNISESQALVVGDSVANDSANRSGISLNNLWAFPLAFMSSRIWVWGIIS